MIERKNHGFVSKCSQCGKKMIFHPGCCGHLPVWRCEQCGALLKWGEPIMESDKYLILK